MTTSSRQVGGPSPKRDLLILFILFYLCFPSCPDFVSAHVYDHIVKVGGPAKKMNLLKMMDFILFQTPLILLALMCMTTSFATSSSLRPGIRLFGPPALKPHSKKLLCPVAAKMRGDPGWWGGAVLC